MNKHLFLATAVLCLLLASCNPKHLIETEQISFTKSFCLTDACNDSLSLSYEIEFPTLLDNKEALARIQQDIISRIFSDEYKNVPLQEAINKYVAFSREEYMANNRAYAEKLRQEEDEFAASLSEEQVTTGRVTWFGNCKTAGDICVLTYELEQYVYMGGAHGVNTRMFFNYDTQTGRLLTESDIFREGFEQPVARLLQNTLIEQSEEFHSRQDFLDAGFEFDSIHPNGNFALTDDAVTYLFNPYEIAPYVYGETEITLDRSLIKDYLKK
ncbi:MAG: DUF3298 domain-containing protein [Paludibacteraceae bacterium]|nr:DUF3298 domain-containing protein [Paludibacteraceae bacterium]